MLRKPKVGRRVRVIEHGAGTVSGKRGVVFVPPTNGRGIPLIPGEYKPMGKDDVAIRFDDGDSIVIAKSYLRPDLPDDVGRESNPGVREIGRHVYDFDSAKKFLGRKDERKLAQNTLIAWLTVPFQDGGGIIGVRYHGTWIVKYREDGAIIVTSGGYHTFTTKQRLNQLLPPGYGVFQHKFDWFMQTPNGRYPFEDGAIIHPGQNMEYETP